MSRKLKNRIFKFITFQLMVAMIAIGLYPLGMNVEASCGCATPDSTNLLQDDLSTVENVAAQSCVAEQSKSPQSLEKSKSTCCSLKPVETETLCPCQPEATTCSCNDCRCVQEDQNEIPLPAIPANENSEVVAPQLICSAPVLRFPRETDFQPKRLPKSSSEHAANSAQETCVLLSRFTC